LEVKRHFIDDMLLLKHSNMQLFLSRSTLADNVALFSPRDIYHWNSSFPDMEPNKIALRILLM